ncbi:MAG: cytochrome c, partial [Xanthobacteraceae bacterium]
MSMFKSLAGAALLTLAIAAPAIAGDTPGTTSGNTPSLGKPISEADIKPWDISVLPDGTNLPPGSGTAVLGAKLYVDKGCN